MTVKVADNVYKTPYGTFQVQVRNGAARLTKTFKSLGEAILARDAFLFENGLFVPVIPEGFQWCSGHKEPKPIENFTPGYKRCKECINGYQRDWRSDPEVRERDNAKSRARNAKDPSAQRNRQLKSQFGIDLAAVEAKESEQGGVCAICRKPETAVLHGKVIGLAVDHDHEHDWAHTSTQRGCPECIRGLLCRECNMVVLGRVGDDVMHFLLAVEYLIEHKIRQGRDFDTAGVALALKRIGSLLESS